ncbi:hypothetical protein ACO0QE_004068 [Hanseniaspora vineae]
MTFDPLDFLSACEPVLPTADTTIDQLSLTRKSENTNELCGNPVMEENGVGPLQIIDLPPLQYMPAFVIFTILKLISPSENLNFGAPSCAGTDASQEPETIENFCLSKELLYCLFERTFLWFKDSWNTEPFQLTSEESFLRQLLSISGINEQDQLSFLTQILSYYNKLTGAEELTTTQSIGDTDVTSEMVLKQCSLRISERCGRTAQPSSTKAFQLEGLPKKILLHEPGMVGDFLGLKTWGAALPLSQRLMNMDILKDFLVSGGCGDDLKLFLKNNNKTFRVLELGAGTGLAGIAFALKVLHSVTAGIITVEEAQRIEILLTDLPEIVPNLQKNVVLNNLTDIVETAALDWTDHDAFVNEHDNTVECFDLILIADPIYSPRHPYWVIDTVLKFLRKKPAQGLVALEIPKRDMYEKERQTLWNLIEHHGLAMLEEDLENGVDDFGETQYIYKKFTYK